MHKRLVGPAFGTEDAHIVKAGRSEASGQRKIFDCSTQSIAAVCAELVRHSVGLRNSSGRTQLETLRRALEFRGSRGLNTYEGTAAGYMRLATRVKELKEMWRIYTLSEDVIGPDGLLHRGVARYVLLGPRQRAIVPVQSELELRVA